MITENDNYNDSYKFIVKILKWKYQIITKLYTVCINTCVFELY